MPASQPQPETLAPPLVQTGDYLANRARRLHSMLTALNDVISGLVKKKLLSTEAPKYKQWKAFLKDWGGWYRNADVGAFWSMSGTDATLEGYERTGQQWSSWVTTAFPTAAADVPAAPPTFPPNKLPSFSLPAWAIGVALLGGGFIAYKVLK